jgi:hypothetical protein
MLENKTDAFANAIHKMAFHSDTSLSGNYGPANTVIDLMTAQLATGLQTTFAATDRIKDIVGVDYSFGIDDNYVKTGFNASGVVESNTKGLLNQITKNSEKSPSDAAFLSNITALAKGAVHEVRLSVFSDEITALSMALMAIENDSKSWVEYYDYTSGMGERISKNIGSIYNDNGVLKDAKKPYRDLINSLNYPGGGRIFRQSATSSIYELKEWSKQSDKRIGDGRWDN